jgi:hypothetical protein
LRDITSPSRGTCRELGAASNVIQRLLALHWL